MPDRPAAELLAEWRRLCAADSVTYPHKAFRVGNFEHVLERLARAEQALAAIEALHTLDDQYGACDGCERQFPCGTIRALRASQGGQ